MGYESVHWIYIQIHKQNSILFIFFINFKIKKKSLYYSRINNIDFYDLVLMT